jgi:hypothetical protein
MKPAGHIRTHIGSPGSASGRLGNRRHAIVVVIGVALLTREAKTLLTHRCPERALLLQSVKKWLGLQIRLGQSNPAFLLLLLKSMLLLKLLQLLRGLSSMLLLLMSQLLLLLTSMLLLLLLQLLLCGQYELQERSLL